MIVKTHRSKLHQMNFPSPEEETGRAILALLRRVPWTRDARAEVSAPSLGDTRVVERVSLEDGCLEEIHIECTEEVFNAVSEWIDALKARGWWGF